ncbi:actin-like protein [Cryptosporidium ubiquitum]|uniref:Actin-like protein n=1 Tax=Cryptosporidium ubiquitum TaxID=857276 RepID=A0A1J4ME24_9CRYT|nr:actin-like protein [Cryptosporidium ubiquitum]OII71276.1 actin-like protein [Cryptosporidium ubiquitum]
MKTIIFEPGRTLCKGGNSESLLPIVEIPSVCCIKDFEKGNNEHQISELDSINKETNNNTSTHNLKSNNISKDELKKIFLVGNEAIDHLESVNGNLIYPLHRNLVMSDWILCELIWDQVLFELGIKNKVEKLKSKLSTETESELESEKQVLMVILPSSGGILIKEKISEWLKTNYDFEQVIFVPGYLLTLYSYGKETGIVVDVGAFWTNITPVIEGVSDDNYSLSIPIGGRSLEDYMKILLSRRGLKFSGKKHTKCIEETKDDLIVKNILSENCFVSTNEKNTREIISCTTSYLELIQVNSNLNNNKAIFLEEERFQVTEDVFFKPYKIGIESPSICEAILKVINKCPLDTRTLLMENIFLTGRSSLFIGLPQRIQVNLTKLFLNSKLKGDIDRLNKYKFYVHDDPMRDVSSFKGANIYLQLI